MFTSSNQRGFTLIELVSVIVIAAVLAAVAAEKFSDIGSGVQSKGFYDEVISSLRYAQSIAMAQNGCAYVTFNSATQLTFTFAQSDKNSSALPQIYPSNVTTCTATQQPLNLPAGGTEACGSTTPVANVLNAPCSDGVPAANILPSPFTFHFDALGNPVGINTQQQFTVHTSPVDVAYKFFIESGTGYVHP